MTILNIAGYKFIAIDDRETLRNHLLTECNALGIHGTILLSPEGINVSLAGEPEKIAGFLVVLRADNRFTDMTFHESFSKAVPFKFMKVKLKNEIITLRRSDADPLPSRAPHLSPAEFKKWLDENRDMIVLDTRNDYEFRFGTFDGAVNLNIADFGEFPEAVETIAQDKPIVMFCTGGVRCEKAAIYMQNHGYENVYQLDGGILGYFREVGGAHWTGDCFVFDERIAVDSQLQPTKSVQCGCCQSPVTEEAQQSLAYVPEKSCPACFVASV